MAERDARGGLAGFEARAADKVIRPATIPFFLAHLVVFMVVFTGVTGRAVLLAVVLYLSRTFLITAGYHRYFSHRSYRLGRGAQAALAFLGTTAVQKGPLWWAANHRTHHRFTDTDRDPHSPQRGFWWSHVGWLLCDRYSRTDFDVIDDFARYPELRWINKHDWIGPWSLGVASYLIAGWSGLVVGFFGSTVLLWHATFSINSVAHLWGSRRYGTADSSRNNPVLAILCLGEGWHNNHHHHPQSARQGFRAWEFDPTYLVLRALQAVRIVHDLREPPPAKLRARRLAPGDNDLGMMRYHLARIATVARRSDQKERVAQVLESTAEQLASLTRRPSSPVEPST
jgi:stearoyl-CoA desaturase (delta-9 desaturase)